MAAATGWPCRRSTPACPARRSRPWRSSAIHLPWFQISDRRSHGGSSQNAAITPRGRLGGVPSRQVRQGVHLDAGFTRVQMAEQFDAPVIRITSPLPGLPAACGPRQPLTAHGHHRRPRSGRLAGPAGAAGLRQPPAGAPRADSQQPRDKLRRARRLREPAWSVTVTPPSMPRRPHRGRHSAAPRSICSGLHATPRQRATTYAAGLVADDACPPAPGRAPARARGLSALNGIYRPLPQVQVPAPALG